MKPRLGSYVYVITYVDSEPYCITKSKVYMKNNEAFITEDMLSDFVIEEYRRELLFEGDESSWAKTLKEAKEIVKKHIEYWNDYRGTKYKPVFKKVDDSAWNVELEEV